MRWLLFMLLFGSLGAQAAPKCPYKSFTDFARALARDPKLQVKYAQFPLKRARLDKRAKPPKVVTESITQKALKGPIIMPLKERRRLGLIRETVTPIGAQRMEYKFSRDNTEFQISYLFDKAVCWQLIAVFDNSR